MGRGNYGYMPFIQALPKFWEDDIHFKEHHVSRLLQVMA